MVSSALIKMIIVDVDGTLLSLQAPIAQTYAEILARSGITASRDALEERIKQVWSRFRDMYLNVSGGYATTHAREEWVWKEFIRRVLGEAGVPIPQSSLSQAVDAIYLAYAEGSTRTVAPGAMDFLRGMQRLMIPVVAATNNDQRTEVVVQQLGLTRYIHAVYVSGDIGWKKPSTKFFTSIAEREGIACRHVLHVGNDFNLDVTPALEAGMQAFLFSDAKEINGVARVRSFSELARVIAIKSAYGSS